MWALVAWDHALVNGPTSVRMWTAQYMETLGREIEATNNTPKPQLLQSPVAQWSSEFLLGLQTAILQLHYPKFHPKVGGDWGKVLSCSCLHNLQATLQVHVGPFSSSVISLLPQLCWLFLSLCPGFQLSQTEEVCLLPESHHPSPSSWKDSFNSDKTAI